MITQLESLKMRLKFRAASLQVTCLSMSFPILVHWEYVPVLSLSIYNWPLFPAHIPSAFPFLYQQISLLSFCIYTCPSQYVNILDLLQRWVNYSLQCQVNFTKKCIITNILGVIVNFMCQFHWIIGYPEH